MGWDPLEASLRFLTAEALRPGLFMENLCCGLCAQGRPPGPGPGPPGPGSPRKGQLCASTGSSLPRCGLRAPMGRRGQGRSRGLVSLPWDQGLDAFPALGTGPLAPGLTPCSLPNSSEQDTAFVYLEKSEAGAKCSSL